MRNIKVGAFLTCLLLFFLSNIAFSQGSPKASPAAFSISGIVLDSKSNEPLPYCNVYLSRSLMGSYTEENGSFQINNVAPGTYQLVVSFIGYQTHTQTIELSEDVKNLSIDLTENTQKLEDLTVVIKRDKEWESQLRRFERDLLGEIPLSKHCEIDNPWVVTFTGDKNQFIATAEEPLKITNKALGFGMTLNLDKFIRNGDIFDYQGYFHFELLNPPNEKQKIKWAQNRKTAYQGSITHFLRSLIEDNTAEAGFIIRPAGRNMQEDNVYKKEETNIKDLINISRKGDLWRLDMKEPVLIEYQYEYTHGEPQLSMLTKIPKDEILFSSFGILRDPTKLKIGGYLAEEGVTTLLPEEYLIDGEDLIKKKTELAVRAGFIKSFTDYSDNKPLKLFLRTDKESYYTGETIWLRGYLVDAISNKPIYERDVIHVELFTPEGNLLKKHRLTSINSGANGSIVIPDSISSGSYILKAYTNSFGQAFTRPIQILSFEDENFTSATSTNDQAPTLKFYPESGDLIKGIKTQVAFQSNLDELDVEIFTQNGKKVTSTSSDLNGMGKFELRPDSKQKYYATN